MLSFLCSKIRLKFSNNFTFELKNRKYIYNFLIINFKLGIRRILNNIRSNNLLLFIFNSYFIISEHYKFRQYLSIINICLITFNSGSYLLNFINLDYFHRFLIILNSLRFFIPIIQRLSHLEQLFSMIIAIL
jgi:hypothetical protein